MGWNKGFSPVTDLNKGCSLLRVLKLIVWRPHPLIQQNVDKKDVFLNPALTRDTWYVTGGEHCVKISGT